MHTHESKDLVPWPTMKQKSIFLIVASLLAVGDSSTGLGQTDTLTFQWPVEPFNESHEITGTFGEYRSTSPTGHFHDGVDIPKPDGSPVFPVRDGVVTNLSRTGSNAFVRVRYADGRTDAYVHISPNPAIDVGSFVTKGTTVLGTILPGLGHVHFTHGPNGDERNALGPIGGFAPFVDTYPPIIRFVKFYPNGSTSEFPDGKVHGLVDIVVKVDEQNGPPWTSVSRLNNGTYAIGYKILGPDRSTVVYEPPENGLRYKFDRIPSDAYVNIVYFRPLSSTTSHVYTVTNGGGASSLVVGDGYWDTRSLVPGKYWVMVFTYDTRFNADTVYAAVEVVAPDLTPPMAVRIHSVAETNPRELTIRWYPNSESDLRGYRLFSSIDGLTWHRRLDEAILTRASTSFTYRNVNLTFPLYFRLTAVDNASAPNESEHSSAYGLRMDSHSTKVLIVDGFNRDSSSRRYPRATHPFAILHGRSIPWSFNTCAREAVLDGTIQLQNFRAVIWFLGDAVTRTETFDSTAQAVLRSYLESGGNLFINGSRFASALGRSNDRDTRAFLSEYLKIDFSGTTTPTCNEVVGAPGTPFQGISFFFKREEPYRVDTLDEIRPVGSGLPVLQCTAGRVMAVAYRGTFGSGSRAGAIVTMAVPFETIATDSERSSLMSAVLNFFNIVTGVQDLIADRLPEAFFLSQNFPNPFNPTTSLRMGVPYPADVSLKIFDVLGREVATLVDEEQQPGTYTVVWDASHVAGGIYFARMQAGSFVQTRRLLLLK